MDTSLRPCSVRGATAMSRACGHAEAPGPGSDAAPGRARGGQANPRAVQRKGQEPRAQRPGPSARSAKAGPRCGAARPSEAAGTDAETNVRHFHGKKLIKKKKFLAMCQACCFDEMHAARTPSFIPVCPSLAPTSPGLLHGILCHFSSANLCSSRDLVPWQLPETVGVSEVEGFVLPLALFTSPLCCVHENSPSARFGPIRMQGAEPVRRARRFLLALPTPGLGGARATAVPARHPSSLLFFRRISN